MAWAARVLDTGQRIVIVDLGMGVCSESNSILNGGPTLLYPYMQRMTLHPY